MSVRKITRGSKYKEVGKIQSFITFVILVSVKSAIAGILFFFLYMPLTIIVRSPVNEYLDIYIYLLLTSIVSIVITMLLFWALRVNIDLKKGWLSYFSPRSFLNLSMETFVMAGVYQFLNVYFYDMFTYGQIIAYYLLFRIAVKLVMRLFSSYLSLSVEAFASRKLPAKAPFVTALIIIAFVVVFKICVMNFSP